MTMGMFLLVAVAILIYLGAAQRVLVRLHLTDRTALAFVGAMVVGGFLPDIPLSDNVSINIGGGIVPLFLAGYLLSKAGTSKEKIRAVLATLITTAAVYLTLQIMPTEPRYNYFLDPMYLFAIIAAVMGYLVGRSRRSAFIAGTMGLLLTDIVSRVEAAISGGAGQLSIGGAGVFDAIVIGGILALLLVEVFGETRELVQGGSLRKREEGLGRGFFDSEFAKEISSEKSARHKDEEAVKREE
ncbi:MAG: DUF1614 domain-containing protein [Dethiobacter sp.]|nr:DUF1614 domain-containing protein [Dethiobacter sp.]MBS3900342.1 DUF1614 domain-containing protein [Dethiobacter sp.]MBS3983201.1 DUF1614 domain-containing protein [Dethiobacter sp.]